jgi:UDP-N-acetylmuramate-alanine ligase
MFKKLVSKIPEDGVVIANSEGQNVRRVIKAAKAQVVFYDSMSFKNFPTPFKGNIWRQNSAAVIALARCIRIDDKTTRKALRSFLGIKRRQEVRLRSKNIVIIDDNAHTPVKVAGCLDAIAKMFPGHSLYAIYEPGNRSNQALDMAEYRKCFKGASGIILPRVSATNEEAGNFNKKLSLRLAKYYKNCHYIESDEKVILWIKKLADAAKETKKKIAFVFMSQKGFRGMIDQAVKLL